MQGKPAKKSPAAKRSIQESKGKTQWEPDHTPMDAIFNDEGVPAGGTEVAPHLPFDPLEEQEQPMDPFTDHLDRPDPFRPMERKPGTVTRSGRASNPPELFMEQVYAVFDDSDAVEDYALLKQTDDPIALAAWTDTDTFHYHPARLS